MKNRIVIKERYLRDKLPVRLGGLAANLARIRSFSSNAENYDVIESLLDESKFFIEWTAAEMDVDRAAELVDLQIQLALWQISLARIWEDASQRVKIAEQSRLWSERVLDMTGLLS